MKNDRPKESRRIAAARLSSPSTGVDPRWLPISATHNLFSMEQVVDSNTCQYLAQTVQKHNEYRQGNNDSVGAGTRVSGSSIKT
ncbi:hypothetical protein EUGRSUZ_B03291 [Eucalyptus grandis]|uniref:Uncharacterized protein n=2 Tax=Eucalyptus grandis TaxID=71139 RepID=A0ACC3LX34_EUCGR|nr:hypothetical protein EUGRSUZ_B03291 [Eucalyptus grandis]